ncbi:MAG: saccharopine dehydrogenase NADP-binding domain-containing protein, partial [Chloroflexota bacterium]
MKILLLGVGMQGKVALADLARSADVSEVVATDRQIDALRAHIADMGYGPKVRPEMVDAADPGSIDRLLAQGPDVVVDLLPVPFSDSVAEAAVTRGVHLVNTIYTSPALRRLAAEAQAKGITLLPESGLDPGIDLAMLGQAA